MESYRARVDALAREKGGTPLFSGSFEQASILIEKFFAIAKSSICILSDNLNARVYGGDEVIEQAALFLAERNHYLQILLEVESGQELEKHPFFERFSDYDNVMVRLLPEQVRGRYDFHFVLYDEDGYRFQPKKDEDSAVAAFGDKVNAAHLKDMFYVLWDEGFPVQIHTKERALA
jgi:hypothetical protein